MKKLKILLDTSVYSAMLDDRDPIRQKQTEDFWKSIDNFELYFSNINVEEIEAVKNEEIKKKLKEFLKKANKIKITNEVDKMKSIYVKEGLIPEKFENTLFYLL